MNTITRQHRNPYVHRSCIASVCAACDGTGRTLVTRGTWTGVIRCETCDGYGETYRSEFAADPADSPEPPPPAARERIIWGGHIVHAPGFTRDQFERAMTRAFSDDLQVKATSKHGEYVVHHPGHTSGYRVTRERCTCKAGEVGTPCKHRAVLIAHLDVRAPYVDRQWAELMADRATPASA